MNIIWCNGSMAMLIVSVTLCLSMSCICIHIYVCIAYNFSITSSIVEAWKVPKSNIIFNNNHHQGEQKGATP